MEANTTYTNNSKANLTGTQVIKIEQEKGGSKEIEQMKVNEAKLDDVKNKTKRGKKKQEKLDSQDNDSEIPLFSSFVLPAVKCE